MPNNYSWRPGSKSFITPELAEIHLPAQGGENTSSGRLQVAVQRGEGVEEIPKLNENPNLEIQSLRRGIVEQQDKMARERQDSAALDSSRKERRLLKGRIYRGQQERGKKRKVLGDKDLRTELRQVIGTLQIEDLKGGEHPDENMRQTEELSEENRQRKAPWTAVGRIRGC